jgi:hypothetical protein
MFDKRYDKILIIILFIFATSFWLFQHNQVYSWDYSAYVMNAQYWSGEGNYYEHYRAPLTSGMIWTLSLFGWEAARYLYIIFVSLLFLYSSLKLAESLNFDKLIFYAISLNPFIIFYGLSVGTELLSLALLELFVVGLIKGKQNGIFGGLASIARYQFIIFFPLIIFQKSFKKIFIDGFLYGIPILGWFLIDKLFISGHFLTSFANSYALNVKYRTYLHSPVDLIHFGKVMNILTPLFLIGIIVIGYELLKKKEIKEYFKKNRIHFIFFAICLISLYIYLKTPLKTERYLFPLSIGIFYFSYVGLDHPKLIMFKKIFVFIIITIALAAPIHIGGALPKNTYTLYNSAINEVDDLKLQDCAIKSNVWVPLNYLGLESTSAPRKELVEHYVKEGQILILFHGASEPEYAQDKEYLSRYPHLYESEGYSIIGNDECFKDKSELTFTYTQKLNKSLKLLGYRDVETHPCAIMFRENVLSSVCGFLDK